MEGRMLERLINQTNRNLRTGGLGKFPPFEADTSVRSPTVTPRDFIRFAAANRKQRGLCALMARRCSTINSSIRYCALRPAPQLPRYRQAVGLSESCPKIGDVPKSPFPSVAALVPSAGAINSK